MEFLGIVIFVVLGVLINNFKRKLRRDYYRNDYLKSDAWQRKRYLVLKRDNWRCVYCGARATQVHHLKYAKTLAVNRLTGWFQFAKNAIKQDTKKR